MCSIGVRGRDRKEMSLNDYVPVIRRGNCANRHIEFDSHGIRICNLLFFFLFSPFKFLFFFFFRTNFFGFLSFHTPRRFIFVFSIPFRPPHNHSLSQITLHHHGWILHHQPSRPLRANLPGDRVATVAALIKTSPTPRMRPRTRAAVETTTTKATTRTRITIEIITATSQVMAPTEILVHHRQLLPLIQLIFIQDGHQLLHPPRRMTRASSTRASSAQRTLSSLLCPTATTERAISAHCVSVHSTRPRTALSARQA